MATGDVRRNDNQPANAVAISNVAARLCPAVGANLRQASRMANAGKDSCKSRCEIGITHQRNRRQAAPPSLPGARVTAPLQSRFRIAAPRRRSGQALPGRWCQFAPGKPNGKRRKGFLQKLRDRNHAPANRRQAAPPSLPGARVTAPLQSRFRIAAPRRRSGQALLGRRRRIALRKPSPHHPFNNKST